MTSSPRLHPTTFFLDRCHPITGKQDTLQEYVNREDNSDVSFCQAWLGMNRVLKIAIYERSPNSQELLNILDVIQKHALSHFPPFQFINPFIVKPIHGKTEVPNWYGISKGTNADEQGIIDLIRKIWVDKETCELVVTPEDSNLDQVYVLRRDALILITDDDQQKTIYTNETSTCQNTLEKINDLFVSLFDDGINTTENGKPIKYDRMKLVCYGTAEERQRKALKILGNLFTNIKAKESEREKIELICITARDLMQQHPYYDGNARAVFIFANFLLRINGLQAFYPQNMCMFDANSVERMVQEVQGGQERLTSSYGSEDDLTNGLDKYLQALQNASPLVKDSHILLKIFSSRNFDLLLRQASQSLEDINLVSFLLEHIETLNIDKSAKGEKSGTPLDVALKANNTAAVKLLQQHGFKSATAT